MNSQTPKMIGGPRSFLDYGYLVLNAKSHRNGSKLPLMCLSIGGISVYCNLREELVDQTQEPWIARTEGGLKKRGGCLLMRGALNTFVGDYLSTHLSHTFLENGREKSRTLL